MHSPTGGASPTLSDTSSDTPEHEIENDIQETATFTQQGGSLGFGTAFASFLGGTSITGVQKRRLPGGLMFGGGSGARDPKSRRKEVRGPGGTWDQGLGPARGHRDDLVDSQLVEQLRNQFGDPFDETIVKNASGGN
ncbi:hypothetical protein C8Q74DRAFT_1218343 [Fomes fomentarius]|nr:hypothetical protein C8Q74DRAFT_1218343 [Fomes fomentarius]